MVRGPVVAADLGVTGRDAVQDFETIIVRLTSALDAIAGVFSRVSRERSTW